MILNHQDIHTVNGQNVAGPIRINNPMLAHILIYGYAGYNLDETWFENYCCDKLFEAGVDSEKYTLVDTIWNGVFTLLCMPTSLTTEPEFVDGLADTMVEMFKKNFYCIYEFDSMDSLEKCLKCLPKIKREIKYCDKRKVFYMKCTYADGITPIEFGTPSKVPQIRYDVLKDISGVFISV